MQCYVMRFQPRICQNYTDHGKKNVIIIKFSSNDQKGTVVKMVIILKIIFFVHISNALRIAVLSYCPFYFQTHGKTRTALLLYGCV